MKHKPYFWILANVEGVFNNGLSVSIEINRVDAKNMPNVTDINGKSPWFENVAFQFYGLVAGERANGYKEIHTAEPLDHSLVEGQQIAVLCTHNDMLAGTATLGLEVHGWTFTEIYDRVRREVGKANREVFERKQALHEASIRERNCPIRLMLGTKMLRMGTGDEFARFFEYKGWPEGVNIHINVKGAWVPKNDLQMLPCPKGVRNMNRPDWRGTELEALYQSVVGRSQILALVETAPEERTEFKGKKVYASVSAPGEQEPLGVPLAEVIDSQKGDKKTEEKAPALPKALKKGNREKRREALPKKAKPAAKTDKVHGDEGASAAA